MTESSHMVEIRGSFDPVLIPFSSFSPFSILGGPKKCPKVGRIDPERGAAVVLEVCAQFYERKLHFHSTCAICAF